MEVKVNLNTALQAITLGAVVTGVTILAVQNHNQAKEMKQQTQLLQIIAGEADDLNTTTFDVGEKVASTIEKVMLLEDDDQV